MGRSGKQASANLPKASIGWLVINNLMPEQSKDLGTGNSSLCFIALGR